MDIYDKIIEKRRRDIVEAQRQLSLAINARIRDCDHPCVYSNSSGATCRFGHVCKRCGLCFDIESYIPGGTSNPLTNMLRTSSSPVFCKKEWRAIAGASTFRVKQMMFEALVRPSWFSMELLEKIFANSPWSVKEVLTNNKYRGPMNVFYETEDQWNQLFYQ